MLYSTPIGVTASGKAGGMREGTHGMGTGTTRPAGEIAQRATDPGEPDDGGLMPGPEPGTWGERLVEWTAAHPRAPLAAALLLALAARIFLVARSHAMLDGDEALIGIQAESILRGARPFYLYSQPYMGSLEAYLAAALFRVFRPSAWAPRSGAAPGAPAAGPPRPAAQP